MDAINITVSLSFDGPIDHEQLTQIQDKFYELMDSEVNDGMLSIDNVEITDFEITVERIDT